MKQTDLYQRITDCVIAKLEAGVIPWRKTWAGREAWPKNIISGKTYRGINLFLLACADHASPYWLTFKQAQDLGGSVKKGEKATPIIYWQWLEKTDPETGDVDKLPLLRHYNVFNFEQCELPEKQRPAAGDLPATEFSSIDRCEQVIAGMPAAPTIRRQGLRAFYRKAEDLVQVPGPERFERSEEFYSTLFHELSHATGHPSRLNREGITEAIEFGSDRYGKEELIAEMGAAFLCGYCGIEPATLDNTASYIDGWLNVLKTDKRLVIHAAAAAQKAADYILNVKPEETA